MSGSYEAAVNQIETDLIAALPSRVISRDYLDFADQPDELIAKGIFTILSRGIESYDYEVSDHFTHDPPQTELGAFCFVITGQLKLPESCTGRQIEAAEFGLIKELETFADKGITDETLKDLLLKRMVMSQQLDKPFAWIFSEWRLRIFD